MNLLIENFYHNKITTLFKNILEGDTHSNTGIIHSHCSTLFLSGRLLAPVLRFLVNSRECRFILKPAEVGVLLCYLAIIRAHL